MPFVTAARQFLEDQGELSEDKNVSVMIDTVAYLLENAVGMDNAISTDKIVAYLKDEKGHKINRHQWEILVLGKLRDEGVFIASHKSKGMYQLLIHWKTQEILNHGTANELQNNNSVSTYMSDLIEFGHWET